MTAKQNNGDFLCAYLAVGDDALKREAVRKKLRRRIEALGDLSFNSEEFDGASASGEAIVAACNTLPFASPLRLVDVTSAEKLKKADSEPLVEYLARPCESTVLLLSAEKLAANTRLYKAVAKVGKNAVINCATPKKDKLSAMVRSMAVGYGAIITPDAAKMLVDRVGEDTVHLDAEVRKLALGHAGSDPITAREVASEVAQTAEVSPWELVEAFGARQPQRCLGLLTLMSSTSPLALLGFCTTRVRELLCASSLQARGYTGASALAAALKKQEWQVKKVYAARGAYRPDELRRALVSARDAERAMKSGADPHGVLVDWLVDTMAAPRRR
ncbi:DNA polymerase III subunit delta [Eggerthellaceae bacterium zg-887]|uniref:DNA polymerase III subunit delta n=1 Tax=Xiamenia xianingshaonis TaxID=2682776 RepID=UPI00140D5BF2|nr:DNA polymerase III subunit delta [Xiamenia xianingshaonis]NHM15651.1 DNA polymerase III subunit delta [Xiamenia xianingshaonis]